MQKRILAGDLFRLIAWFGFSGAFFNVFGGAVLFVSGSFAVGEFVINLSLVALGISCLALFLIAPFFEKREVESDTTAA